MTFFGVQPAMNSSDRANWPFIIWSIKSSLSSAAAAWIWVVSHQLVQPGNYVTVHGSLNGIGDVCRIGRSFG